MMRKPEPCLTSISASVRFRTIHRVSVVFFAAALLTAGCVVVEQDSLFNNSGQSLTIVIKGAEKSPLFLKQEEHLLFCSPCFEIRHSTGTWRYGRKPFVLESRRAASGSKLPKLYRSIGGNRVLVGLQVERDGTIYVTYPDSKTPTASFPPQPEGFPMKPQ
jgi:hypothetical protein